MSQQINLFNPLFRKKSLYFSLPAMLQGLGGVAAGALLFYGYAFYQVNQLAGQSEETNRLHAAEQKRLAGFIAEFSPQQSSQLLRDELRRLEKQFAEQAELVETVKSGVVGNTSGYSEYLRAFSRQAAPGLWLTGFRVSGGAAQISLNGAVLDPGLLPAYIQRLGKENVMRGKTFSNLQMRLHKADAGGASYVEFSLQSGADNEANK